MRCATRAVATGETISPANGQTVSEIDWDSENPPGNEEKKKNKKASLRGPCVRAHRYRRDEKNRHIQILGYLLRIRSSPIAEHDEISRLSRSRIILADAIRSAGNDRLFDSSRKYENKQRANARAKRGDLWTLTVDGRSTVLLETIWRSIAGTPKNCWLSWNYLSTGAAG